MRNLFRFLILFVVLGTGSYSHAAISPLSINILPPVQFPPESFDVAALRISALWGQQRSFYGIDIGGLGNITEQRFVGMGIAGIFNMTRGPTTVVGLQLAGITNINAQKTSITGFQIAGFINSNQASSTMAGIQLAGLANINPFTDIYGLEIGLYNKAQNVYGVQIGLFNVAKSLHGIQIGLLNFNDTGLFAISPIINIGF